MKFGLKHCGVALLLTAVSTLSHALVFAVNEGVTYRVPNEEIRAKYAAIAADLVEAAAPAGHGRAGRWLPGAAPGPGRQGVRPRDGASGASVDRRDEAVGLSARRR